MKVDFIVSTPAITLIDEVKVECVLTSGGRMVKHSVSKTGDVDEGYLALMHSEALLGCVKQLMFPDK